MDQEASSNVKVSCEVIGIIGTTFKQFELFGSIRKVFGKQHLTFKG